MFARAHELRPGLEPFPGYRLDCPIGQGGWSDVWKAYRPDGSPCALKFMPCREDGAPAIEVRALHALRSVRHPNLLAIENVWSCPGHVVIVMELADGSLHDLLEVYLSELRSPMSVEHVCFFLGQVAAALDFLNERQHDLDGRRVAFRHCDVKPSNLLVFGNEVRLADFSLATPVTAPRWHHRRTGTPAYSAPEVFQGWISDRTDQYALAISYYQLRTGRYPFAEMPSSYRVPCQRSAPDLTHVSAGEQLALARALALAPIDRWPSCGALMRCLGSTCAPPGRPIVTACR